MSTRRQRNKLQTPPPTAAATAPEVMPAEPSLGFEFKDITGVTSEELKREALAADQYLRSVSAEERERYLDRVGFAARNASLVAQVRVGMTLIVQKEAVSYGLWGEYLEERGYTSSARRWMRIARAAADGTIDLRAEQRLTGQQVLALLAPKPASEEARLAKVDADFLQAQEEAEEKAPAEAKAAEQRWLDERQELFERLRSVGLSSTEAQGLLEKPEEAQAILDRRRAEEQQQSAGDQEAGEEDGLEPDDEEDERRAQLSLVSSRDKDIDAAKQDDKRRQGRLDALSEDEKTAGDREGGEEEQKVCAICHNLFSETDTPVSTENGHCHRDCVQQEHLRGMIVQFRVTLNRLVRTKSLAQLALAELAPVIDHLKTRGKENPEGQANTFMVAIDAFLKSEQSPYSPVVIED